MISGVIKLFNKEEKEISKRSYYSKPMRTKILKEWAEDHGENFNGMAIHIIPDFDEDLYDDKGRRITSLTKRLDFVKEKYNGNAMDISVRLGVSYETIRKDVHKIYGRETKKPNTEQLEFIKNNYQILTAKGLAKELNLKVGAVYHYLSALKLKAKPSEEEKAPFRRPPATYSNKRHY